jgi:S1-C subfamily serine protease
MFSCLLLTVALGQAPVKVPNAVEKDALDAAIRVSIGTEEGSGVLIGRIGIVSYALTAAHVVKGRDQADVVLLTGQPGKPGLTATIEKRTSIAGADLALLRIQDPQGQLLKKEIMIAENAKTSFPFPAYSIGLPGKNKRNIIVEKAIGDPNVTKSGESARFWKCAAIPTDGRSGGALVDDSGKLIGICSGGDNKHGYYTHVDEIMDFVNASGIAACLKK